MCLSSLQPMYDCGKGKTMNFLNCNLPCFLQDADRMEGKRTQGNWQSCPWRPQSDASTSKLWVGEILWSEQYACLNVFITTIDRVLGSEG